MSCGRGTRPVTETTCSGLVPHVTSGGSLAASSLISRSKRAHVLRLGLDQRLGRQHVLDLGGADAVGERAEGAVSGGVAIATDERSAGEREALLGSDDVDDALALVELVEIFEPEQLGILREVGDLRRA